MKKFLIKYSRLLLSTSSKKQNALTIEVLNLIASNISDMQEMSRSESISRGNDIKEFIFDYKEALK